MEHVFFAIASLILMSFVDCQINEYAINKQSFVISEPKKANKSLIFNNSKILVTKNKN